jgi:hypothetical protein
LLQFDAFIVRFFIILEVYSSFLEPEVEFEVRPQHLEALSNLYKLLPNVMQGMAYFVCCVVVVTL